jgi:hypothetical protein
MRGRIILEVTKAMDSICRDIFYEGSIGGSWGGAEPCIWSKGLIKDYMPEKKSYLDQNIPT